MYIFLTAVLKKRMVVLLQMLYVTQKEIGSLSLSKWDTKAYVTLSFPKIGQEMLHRI